MPKFTLSIDLGNDAMRLPNDIADALLGIAQKIQDNPRSAYQKNKIMDINGNTVGYWMVR